MQYFKQTAFAVLIGVACVPAEQPGGTEGTSTTDDETGTNPTSTTDGPTTDAPTETTTTNGVTSEESTTGVEPDPNQPPVFDEVEPVVLQSVPFTIKAHAEDPDGDPLDMDAEAPAGCSVTQLNSSTMQIQCPPLEVGEYEATFVASDQLATTQMQLPISIVEHCDDPSNQPPTIEPVADQVVEVGELVEIQISAEDPDGDPISYFPVQKPIYSGLNTETGLFGWTPPKSGVHTLILGATDGCLDSTVEFVLTAQGELDPGPDADGDGFDKDVDCDDTISNVRPLKPGSDTISVPTTICEGVYPTHLKIYGSSITVKSTGSVVLDAGSLEVANLHDSNIFAEITVDKGQGVNSGGWFGATGIYIHDSDDNFFTRLASNMMASPAKGIYLESASGNTIERCFAWDNEFGLWLDSQSNNNQLTCWLWDNDKDLTDDGTNNTINLP